MKKSELLARIVALENSVTVLQAQLAMQKTPAPVVLPWTAPYQNHPPYIASTTTPWNPYVPPVTICDATRTQ